MKGVSGGAAPFYPACFVIIFLVGKKQKMRTENLVIKINVSLRKT